MNLLDTYVRGWRESADALLELAATFDDADWSRPTDCPGWTVHDVIAHVAHLETELCSTTQHPYDDSAATPAGAPTEVVSSYTEAGVAARRDRTPVELLAELTGAVEIRAARLADLPDDPAALAPATPGGVAWSWDTLLRNRAIDLWVHEQDVRRATDRPGGLSSTGAQVAVMTFSFAMPYVLGKRVRPVPGTTVRWDITGDVALDMVVQIGDDGRAQRVDPLDTPSATLSMSSEAFTTLAAGRRTPDQVEVEITGDPELAHATLAAMAVTP